MAHKFARRMIETARREVTGRCVDRETSILRKARLDLWADKLGVLGDLKTTSDASHDGFARSVAEFRYHRQTPFYEGVVRDLGADVKSFGFIAVEKEPPYLVAVHVLGDDARATGEREVRRLIRRLADCVAKNEWPGLPGHVNEIRLPRYYREYGTEETTL